MIKSASTYNLHPLMEKKDGNKLLDYLWRTRTDEKFIPQEFNKKIVFQSFGSFQQNNLFLSKMIRKFVSNQLKTTEINAIGGEAYLYGLQSKCRFYTNSKSIYEDAKFNGYLDSYYIDYNGKSEIDIMVLNECDTVVNLSRLNSNVLKQINNSSSNRVIIINCHHEDFWKKTKLLSNFKLITREKFIDMKSKYFITVNVFIRKCFISLGGNCAVTHNLKRLGMRNKAYPFDWSQNKITQVIETLERNFIDFEKVKIQKYSSNHNSYLVSNKFVKFAHEVLKDEDLETFQMNIVRRIERMRSVKNPVFVRLETFQFKNEKVYHTYCMKLVECLRMYYTNFKIILVSKINPKLEEIVWYPYESFSEDWRNEHLNWREIFTN